MVTFIGDQLRLGDNAGMHIRIATVFPNAETIVTTPGIHMTQRQEYLDSLDLQRASASQCKLTEEERDALMLDAVDLIIDDRAILIRPDPERMDLAFAADALLQDHAVANKRHIRFQFLDDQRVRDAIRKRGEAWRIYPLPKSTDEMTRLVEGSLNAVGGLAIYHYNAPRGTRILTFEQFEQLEKLDDDALRRHLREISDLAGRRNARGFMELELFMAGGVAGSEGALAVSDLAHLRWDEMPATEMRVRFSELAKRFKESVPAAFRHDDVRDKTWRNRMYSSLIELRNDELSEEYLLGLGAEFFMQIEWLPGVRIDSGELIFDTVNDDPGNMEACNSADTVARGLICNLFQEYNDLEFINLGRLIISPSHVPSASSGRRELYMAHFKERGTAKEIMQMIRLQKWGVREHLNEGKDLLRAMIESEEYTDYILDRRVGCKQIGMNLPPRTLTRKVAERYDCPGSPLSGITIWSQYFQRDFIPGFSSDRIPPFKLNEPAYAAALARILGRAAAPNLIVGRCDARGRVIFDDGDEIVIEADGLPQTIIVADHTGTFQDHTGDLMRMIPAYAEPINKRLDQLGDAPTFIRHYLEGFLLRFRQIQKEYRARARAFDTLFKHRKIDPGGNLAFRWRMVLQRLKTADPEKLAEAISAHIRSGPR